MRCFWRIGWANVQWWGALFTAVGLTNGKIDGGAARTDGSEGELCGTFRNTPEGCHCGRKKCGKRASENGGSAKNGEASWGAMVRERKLTTINGGAFAINPAGFRQNAGLFRRNGESCR